jgi:hypothetical protein
VSGLPYKLVVLWESSVVTGRRKSFAVDLKGSKLASWRNLILTFRTRDLIGRFVCWSGTFVDLGRSSVRCSIGAFLEGLDLIWRQAYIEALVWFDLIFDVRSSRIDLVFASWSFERLSDFGDGPLLAAVGLVPSLCLPNILVFHH